jgi:hypothetical protein
MNFDIHAIRAEQNRLKLIYINKLQEFNRVVDFSSSLQDKMFLAKAELLEWERNIPGSDGSICSIDHDPSNREHQSL